MCGIAGFINRKTHLDHEEKIIADMLDTQRHRGPDDSGIEPFQLERGSNGYLGFNRLSILDLSPNGHQPMYNKTREILLTFNGEIYNAFQLKKELIQKGYKFRSKTDTEVLLYLYEEYGLETTLSLIVGMFAFVVVDKRINKIFAARDRLGEKPFYYYKTENVILFASEMKVFYRHPSFDAKINEKVLDEYFMYRYIAGNETLLQNVKVLEPSCYIELDFGKEKIKRYYQQKVQKTRDNHKRCREELDKMLRKSTHEQLISDVPIGIMLSGGIDSSLVAKYVSEKATLQSFSVIFENPEYSEEKWIDYVIDTLQIQSNKYKMTDEEFLQNLVKCVWHCDFPINHPNSLGVYLLCARAREKVTVLLGGEGSDELLGGYERASANCTALFLRKCLGPLYYKLGFGKKFNKFSDERTNYDVSYILSSTFINKTDLLRIRPQADIDSVIKKRLGILEDIHGKSWHKYSEYDQRTYLQDILNRVDKMSMANSMELRCPFLNRDLIDFVRSLKTSLLVRPSFRRKSIIHNGKILLKEICQKYFGHSFTYRKKMGWALPLKEYFMSPPMKRYIEDQLFPGMESRKIVDARVVRQWWKHMEQLSQREIEVLWLIISFEIWAQTFIDNNGSLAFSQNT